MQSSENADFALDPPALAGFVARDLTSGKDVTLLVGSLYGTATLDHAAARLSDGRDRVVCVHAAVDGGLDGAGFLRQLGQHTKHLRQEPTVISPENDIAVLTTLDPTCDRIVLLVADADSLKHDALLAIQLACRSSIRLRLVFAGQPGLLARLDHPELSTLEGRLLRGVRYTYSAEELVCTDVATIPSGGYRRTKLAFVVAACIVLAVLGVQTQWFATFDHLSAQVSSKVAALPSSPLTLPSQQAVQSETEARVDPAPEPSVTSVPNVSPALPANILGDKQSAPTGRPVGHGPLQSVGHSGKHAIPMREADLVRSNEQRNAGSRAASEYRRMLPRNLAERDRSGDYIGTFAAGPDGVRSFQYRP